MYELDTAAQRTRTLQVRDPRDVGRLGFIDPVTAALAVSAIISLAKKWIGQGRREADVITQQALPQLQEQFLGPIWGELQWSVTADNYLTRRFGCEPIPESIPDDRLRTLRDVTRKAAADWLAFLRDRNVFTDGRASGQSANWEMAQMIGHSGYGKFASGGGPSDHVTSGDPDLNTPMDGPPVCGGIVGAIDRELARRAASRVTAAPAPAPAPAPSTIEYAPGTVLPLGELTQPGVDQAGLVPLDWLLTALTPTTAPSTATPYYPSGGTPGRVYSMGPEPSMPYQPAGLDLMDLLPWVAVGALALVLVTKK